MVAACDLIVDVADSVSLVVVAVSGDLKVAAVAYLSFAFALLVPVSVGGVAEPVVAAAVQSA